jgi:hypothetical protein
VLIILAALGCAGFPTALPRLNYHPAAASAYPGRPSLRMVTSFMFFGGQLARVIEWARPALVVAHRHAGGQVAGQARGACLFAATLRNRVVAPHCGSAELALRHDLTATPPRRPVDRGR